MGWMESLLHSASHTQKTPNMTKSALKISTKLFIERAIELEMCTVSPPYSECESELRCECAV